MVIADIETTPIPDNGDIDAIDRIWLTGGIDYATKQRFQFTNVTHNKSEAKEFTKWAESVDVWVGHNFLSFDVRVMNNFFPDLIDPSKVIDTLVVSRLIDYDIDIPKGARSPHSLDAWGIRLGLHKGHFKDFTKFSQEMVDYWNNDLDVTLKLFDRFKPTIFDPDWKKAMRAEHDIQWELSMINRTGFYLDKSEASMLLEEITTEMTAIEQGFQEAFPPKLEEVNRLKYRVNKQGIPYAVVENAIAKYPKTEVVNGELLCYDWKEFNPGSPQQRIERLWEAGWKPFDKTKGHIQFDRELKQMERKGKSKWQKR